MEERIRLLSFTSAVFIVIVCLGYVVMCAWHKPAIDLSAPVLSIITLLLGYYYGSSKSSQDKSERIEKMEKK